jgi:hypothetical protein
MSSDAYIRVGSRGIQSFGFTERHDSLVFVDAPTEGTLAALRYASYALFANAATLLVRPGSPLDSPAKIAAGKTSSFNDLHEQVEKLKLGDLQWGLLHQPVGEALWIEGNVEATVPLLERARAIELEALLDWGDAVWRPDTYHYRLPSGEHAAGFVRVADAIRVPRDAEVIASWLHADLANEVGIVVDTGTLSAVVQALVAAVRSRQNWRPGPVNVLDRYPATGHDVAEAIRYTATPTGIVALLSVNSSGHLRDQMLSALGALASTVPRSLDVLVNKREITASSQERDGTRLRTWHPRPSEDPLVRYDAANADVCELCRQAQTATVISISPRSFDGSLPASIGRLTMSVADARRNRALWEHTDEVKDSIRLEATPKDAVLEWRPPGPMSVALDYQKLLSKQQFRNAAVRALRDELDRNRTQPLPADLVLMPKHEFDLSTRDALVKAMGNILGPSPAVEPFPLRGSWPDDLQKKVKDASKSVAIVTLGVVTGTTLNGALAAVQAARNRGFYELSAYVLHARVTERRAWQTLQNTFDNRIFTAWRSYLPDRSPLRDEASTLQEISESARSALSSDASAFLAARINQLASGNIDQSNDLFWGTSAGSELTPNSIFGQGLHGPAVYVAVASSMERARQEHQGGVVPRLRVFEMPAIVRSYYDPMILAAVLRWLRPYEAWWGREPIDERSIVSLMLERATPEHLLVLLPELLLACAQGKLNRPGVTEVQARASAVLANSSLTHAQRGPLELGMALLPPFGISDAEQQQRYGAIAAIEGAKSKGALLQLVPDLLRDLGDGRLPAQVANALERRIAIVAPDEP